MMVRIHPGQFFFPGGAMRWGVLTVLVSGLAVAAPGAPVQGPPSQVVSTAQGGDSAEVLRAARAAQGRFERIRRREAPRRLGPSSYRCDEVLGRLCLRHGPSSDWWPEPEPAVIQEARGELVTHLAESFAGRPGDRWLAGQLAAYRVESGDHAVLEQELRRCRVPAPAWWCAALTGYALHTRGAWEAAGAAFQEALARMDPETRRRFSDPSALIRGGLPSQLDTLPDRDWMARIEAFWRLSDPLLVTPGNDRWTEHLSRQTLAVVRSDARNPYGLRWGADMEEALIRFGWEFGWERVEPPLTRVDRSASTVGHEHPESRSLLGPGAALLDPAGTRPEDWNPGARHTPHEGYAHPWAPVVLPLESGMLVFPRGDSVLVAAVTRLPSDTTYHAAHGHPDLVGSRVGEGLPARAGLGALTPGGLLAVMDTREGLAATPRITLPAGEYVLSAEIWAPDSARAGRHRTGFRYAPRPPDVAGLSDLVLAHPDESPPETVAALLDRAVAPKLHPGDTVLVGWEITGMGWAPESLVYRLELERDGGGFIQGIGRFLGLAPAPTRVVLSWTEPGPETPGPALRTSLLTVPADADPGDYTLNLAMEGPGRASIRRSRSLRIEPLPR